MNNYYKILRISSDSGLIFDRRDGSCTIIIPYRADEEMRFLWTTTLIISALLFPEHIFGQDLITFENQGWTSNQSLPQSFSVNGYSFSSSEPFYTNYGYNFDVNGVSLYYVFQHPSSDSIIINFPDHTIGNLESFAAYQVSEAGTSGLTVEGWSWNTLKYYQSFPSGTSWELLTLNYENINKIVIKMDSTGEGGLTDYNFDNFSFTGIVTSTERDSSSTVPKNFALNQNYPNPFNPSTVISYKIAKAGNVVLKVYDALGKEVATLVNREQTAGSYSVRFPANASTANLSSGLYIYVLQAGGTVLRNKMILLK